MHGEASSAATVSRDVVRGAPEVTEPGAPSKSRTCGIAGEAHAEMFAASPVIEEADTPERQVKARRSDVDLWISGGSWSFAWRADRDDAKTRGAQATGLPYVD